MPDARLDRVPGTVVTPNRLLGPFETPAAALRFVVRTPLDLVCVRSGWYGPDLELVLAGGERVVAPLAGLRICTRGWWLRVRAGTRSELSDEPALSPFLRWWERPIVQGSRFEVSGTIVRSGSGYRETAAAPSVLRDGRLEQPEPA